MRAAIMIFTNGWMAVSALVAISAYMSLMFPTIYDVTLNDVPGADSRIAAIGLIMAILGGALITLLQAYCFGTKGISLLFMITAVCFAVILVYSILITRLNNARE